MVAVIRPLGTLITTLPIGRHRPGLTAGPTFEMYQMNYLLPKGLAAWIILRERLFELADNAMELSRRPDSPKMLLAVEKGLRLMAKSLEPFVGS
jgi:hypothetical protein